ncbi:hypothetical protein HID58_091752 [Brassica napus]|uniref:GDSL esterase/lipase n=1 Tax=Brassica napus TaxID=3708 RepID=A0ABQ7WZ55_BRANA|nr:hypothetical protein HID58_091752 [Brassica napus]
MGLPSLKPCLLLIFLFLLNVSTINSKRSKVEPVLFGGNFQALYVIGDSLVDSGNNNNLNTSVKANFAPYGSDFEGGKPTGRFSNGKTIADYIAIYYGLPLAPAYMGLSEEQKNNISTGINYASASCGIFPDTGTRLGKCLSLSDQVDLFEKTIDNNLKKKFKTQSELTKHLAGSLFMTAIGVNDYAFYFKETTDPNEFAEKLLHDFLMQIKRLHELGARKFFINNLKPLGCYPNYIVANTVPRGSCSKVAKYNAKLRKSLTHLKKKFSEASFLYSDYFNFMLGLRGPLTNQVSSNLINSISPCCPSVYDGDKRTSLGRIGNTRNGFAFLSKTIVPYLLFLLLCLLNVITIISKKSLKGEAVLFGGNFPALYEAKLPAVLVMAKQLLIILGRCLSMNVQIDLLNKTIEKILRKVQDATLGGSLFMTAIGVNDYAFTYKKNATDANEFASKLLNEFLIHLERLYNLGARNFFVNNIKPLGCYPNIIAETVPRGSCDDSLNLAIDIFNLMEFAQGKIVMALEGGYKYNLDSIAQSSLACIQVLLEDKPFQGSSEAYPFESTQHIIQAVWMLLLSIENHHVDMPLLDPTCGNRDSFAIFKGGNSSQRSVSEGERRLPKESSSDTVVAANLGMGR